METLCPDIPLPQEQEPHLVGLSEHALAFSRAGKGWSNPAAIGQQMRSESLRNTTQPVKCTWRGIRLDEK
jgi:hypothetical protein